MERLQKIIAASGITSRRKAEELITSGQVRVNGHVITTLGTKVSDTDTITINNKKLTVENKVYYILNKPRGVISSVSDDKNRDTVVELIDEKNRIFPVGRLDYEVVKTYVTKVKGKMDMDTLFKLRGGIVVEGVKIKPIQVKIKSYDQDSNTSLIKISIIEGHNHIVKNIFKTLNLEVIKLKREEYGFLTLDRLKSGDYRKLSHDEVMELYRYKKKSTK